MKRFKLITLAIAITLALLCNTAIAEKPRLLGPNIADPGAIIIDGVVYFTGTDGSNNIVIRTISTANLYAAVPSNYISTYYTYNPSAFGNTYTEVMSQHLTNMPGGNVGLMFSARKNGGTTTSFYSYNLGAPTEVNTSYPSYPHTDNSEWSGTRDQERLKLRISDDIFIDDVNGNGIDSTDPQYHCYTYFYQGNNVAVWQQGGTGAQTTAFDIVQNTFNSTYHIVEGGEIFKRGSYYYCIFSTSSWLGGYEMWYKRATTVAGLNTTTAYRLTYPVPQSGYWNNNLQEYGYSKNAGGPCILIDGANYNLIFHVGTPISGSYMYASQPNCKRSTYVARLVFLSNGLISTQTLP